MPNTPSAARHLRKSIKQQARNQAYRTRMRNTIKQARQALTDGDTTATKLVRNDDCPHETHESTSADKESEEHCGAPK